MKFIVTKELGKLARWLRIMGFDTVYCRSTDLGGLVIRALRDGRLIVTRSKGIRHVQKCIVAVNSNELAEQLGELKNRLNLEIDQKAMFTRCTVCNEPLKSIDKEEAKDKVPEYVYSRQESFMRCPNCKKIYWQGSHWGNINEVIKKLSSPLP
jgi:hypothetical protein